MNATYDVNSLSAAGMRTWFRSVIGADITTFEMLGNESIAALTLAVPVKTRYIDASVKRSGD